MIGCSFEVLVRFLFFFFICISALRKKSHKSAAFYSSQDVWAACVCKLTRNIQCIIAYLKGLLISLYIRETIVKRRSVGTFSYDFVPSYNDCGNLHVTLKFAKQYCVTNSFKSQRLIPLTISDNWHTRSKNIRMK